MTDHRITDLSYGHLGEFSYAPDEGEWVSSIDPQNDLDANVLQPLEPCIAPSIQAIPERKQKPSSIARSYRQWSVKTLPEIFPANLITTPLAQAPSAIDIELSSNVGSLLGIGQAADSERVSGSRKPEIFAMPCGEAGHILRLTRPRIESYGWGKQSAVRVALMNPASPDRGYWIGTGGAIRQISFADDDNGSGTWLAVRQATATTIFRPIYREISSASEPLNSYRTAFPSSNLNPNPVAVLTAEQSGSKCHMDVSVNPWYARQFAVIDQLGRWSIWDVEGRGHRSSSLKLVPGRSGQIYDGIVPDAGLKMAEPDLVDGWHRVLWASGVTTIVVCNRRHVAVFDVKATPIRLDCPDFLPANNSDSILDVKRSAMNLSHLFILTTSRIFWIEVTPAGEERDSQNGYIGAKVILSYRHFRDSNDETMKLTVVKDEKVSVLISSGKTLLINFYWFSAILDTTDRPTAFQGAFTLPTDLEQNPFQGSLQEVLLTPVSLVQSSSNSAAGPGLQYVKHDVKFYQLWALASDLGVWSTLCSIRSIGPGASYSPMLRITAPTTKISRSSNNLLSRHVVDDTFIVPDTFDGEKILDYGASDPVKDDERDVIRRQTVEDLRFRINWNKIFQHAFVKELHSDRKDSEWTISSHVSPTVAELLEKINDRINHGKQANCLGMTTLFELSGLEDISGDLDQASPKLSEFLKSVQLDQDHDTASTLVLTELDHTHQSSTNQPIHPLDLLKVYDNLVEIWMASLPLEVSGAARLSKFKIIRKTTLELYLSSVALSLRSKASQVSEIPDQNIDAIAAVPQINKIETMTRDSSPAFVSSQLDSVLLREAHFSLPSPARTPSVYSHGSTATAGDLPEDPVISRLRQYTVSIRSLPDPGKCRLLSHWPSSPGVNPAKYSWEAAKKASASAEGGEGDGYRTRREEARRQRRTEKFLSRERARATDAESQPTFMPSGSQPEVAHHAISSQTVDEQPMTQPDRGAFGSRLGKKSTKKKQRKAGF